MNDNEDVFKLPEDQAPKGIGRAARLDSIKKLRTDQAAGALRKGKDPVLRPVSDTPAQPAEPTPYVLGEDKKRNFFDGKSVDYNIDEILKTPAPATEEGMEKEWGTTNKTIPIGWIFTLSAMTLTVIGFVIYLASTTGKAEIKIEETRQIEVMDQMEENDSALDLVETIELAVKEYLEAKTIDEKLRHVRHADVMRLRMEKFYATNPITPQECRSVTGLQPITLDGRAFWQVVAVTGMTTGQALLLEQISDTEVKIDWESHVHYQPIPWEQYAVELPGQPMAFRLSVRESPRYFGEFSDQNRWVSYQLNAIKSDTIIYGYVLRDSPAHVSINQATQRGFSRMILRLQASKSIQLPNAVVIESFVSADLYRIDPPKTLID
jgi:hypothetical protein